MRRGQQEEWGSSKTLSSPHPCTQLLSFVLRVFLLCLHVEQQRPELKRKGLHAVGNLLRLTRQREKAARCSFRLHARVLLAKTGETRRMT